MYRVQWQREKTRHGHGYSYGTEQEKNSFDFFMVSHQRPEHETQVWTYNIQCIKRKDIKNNYVNTLTVILSV